MNTTLSPVTGQRLFARQTELIELVGQDHGGLNLKLEQIIQAFKYTQNELAVYRERYLVTPPQAEHPPAQTEVQT